MKKALLASLATASLVTLAACGGDDGSENAADSAEDDSVNESETTDDNAAEEPPERSVEAYCEIWQDGEEVFSDANSAEAEDYPEVLENLETVLHAATQAAPDEVVSETANMRNAITSIKNLNIDFTDPDLDDDPQLQEEMQQLEQEFDNVDEDSEAVSEYVEENCENVGL